jgi:DNA-binding transcriptional ArsR family regulator
LIVATGERSDKALRHIDERGEVCTRDLASAIGEPIRATRSVLSALKSAGEVESVRRRLGRVRVFYRRAAARGGRGE